MTDTDLPPQGVVFWQVGTGDSTTIVIDDQRVMQVDLRDMDAADEPDAVVAPVIDRLAEKLPTLTDGTPYLAVFALTHGDLDHCCGFGDLLDSGILIGELWVTPRLWREVSENEKLGEEARRFHEEAQRRVTATLEAHNAGREPVSGERIRVIGYDDDRTEHEYANLPDAYFTFPGQAITTVDGVEVADRFEAFVHAPFRDDCAGERNETSLAMQITLRASDGTNGQVLLVGDLSYVTLKKIFDYSEAHDRTERVAWDVYLAAHHCSRKVMYAPGEDGHEELKHDLLDQFAAHAKPNAQIVASSRPFREKDNPGDNPPHLLAREQYEKIINGPVLCTGEYPDAENPYPIVFGLEPGRGLVLLDVEHLQDSDREALLSKSTGGSRGSLLAGLGAAAALGVAGAMIRQQWRKDSGTAAVRAAAERTRGEGSEPAASIGFGRA